jgi:precorrin-2 dehydrogenase/sirohydrochlorin ferrochelatase
MTDYYPVSLDVRGRACLVVGGGPVAARKARGLLDAGAVVTVIAPQISEAMAALSRPDGALTLVRRTYESGDAASFRLVITATGSPHVDAAVYIDADTAGVWVNSADDPGNCSFILPSVHRDGAVTVSISTGGKSPALATWLRGRLGEACGPGLGDLADLLARARAALKAAGRSTETVDWAGLLNGPLPGLVASGQAEAARLLVEAATGLDLRVAPP